MQLLIVLLFLFGYTLAENVTKTIRLNNGIECPDVGLGTGGFRTGGPLVGEVVKEMIRDAVEVGYRHVDTASAYGNEKDIGVVLNELFTNNKVKREDIFITTKIFSKSTNASKSREDAFNGVLLSLKTLNLTYVDLMLIHYPSNDLQINSQLWKGLEDAVNKKLVKSIGISNFNVTQLESLVKSADIMPAMLQVESHPNLNQSQLIDWCNQYKIRLTAYSPLGAGTLIKDPTIVGIGQKHNKSSAQVMIRWQLQRGVVAIPKTDKKDYLIENFDVFDFSLTEEEMNVLNNMK